MKRVKRKHNTKRDKERKELQEQFELFNGKLVGINKKKIEQAFSDKQDRIEYLKALQDM